jgi:hypothetical protein
MRKLLTRLSDRVAVETLTALRRLRDDDDNGLTSDERAELAELVIQLGERGLYGRGN